MRSAGGVLRERPQRTMPSITTMPMPGRSPSATDSSSVLPAVCCARSMNTKSAGLPFSISPASSLRTRAVLPVAMQNTVSGATPPKLARNAMVRRMPSGCTPEPAGASVPMMTSCVRFNSIAVFSAVMAAFSLPLCTISMAPLACSQSWQMWPVASAVWPPLMWLTTSGLASSTTSWLMRLEPGIDGPPVWMMVCSPCLRHQATCLAASEPVFTVPSPISPIMVMPARAISA